MSTKIDKGQMDLVLRFAVCGLYGTILERSELTWLKCKKDLCAPFAKCKAHTCHLALKCLWFMFYSLILFFILLPKNITLHSLSRHSTTKTAKQVVVVVVAAKGEKSLIYAMFS